MSSFFLNQVILTAIVASEVELRVTPSKKKVGTFSVSIPTVRDDETTWETFSVEVWEGTADACAQYLTKGSKVLISAMLKQSRWMVDEQPRSRVYLRASQVEFIRLKEAGEPRPDEF
jgi:single-strand DNA-binding protein